MKGIFLLGPRQVGILDQLCEPEMTSERILVDVKACGICGGDLKEFAHGTEAYPYFLKGHELSGVVLDVGKEVVGFKPGDKVAYVTSIWCGQCLPCRTGSPEWCIGSKEQYYIGGYGERLSGYIPQHGKGMFVIPEEMDYVTATLAEPLTCAIGIVRKAAVEAGDTVVVLGLGGLGQMVAQLLKEKQVNVIGVDIAELKRVQATPYCSHVLAMQGDELVEAVWDLTCGTGVDRVFDIVGVEATFNVAADLLRVGGTLVFAGVATRPFNGVDIRKYFSKNLSMVTSKGPSPAMVDSQGRALAIEFLRKKVIDPTTLITTFQLEQAQDAFESQHLGTAVKSVIVQS